MSEYKKIMLAVDLTEESLKVAERATQLVNAFDAELHVVHVIEPLSLAYGGDVPMDLSTVQEQIQDQRCPPTRIFSHLKCSRNPPTSYFGRPESEIQRTAEEAGADIIVVGSHGRHGLALLLGSTANGVLHGASCDVLAVRVGHDDNEPT